MRTRTNPLSNYPVVRSSDPAFVRERLFSVYGANSFDVGRANRAFAVDANHLQVGGLGLSYCDYASDVSVGFGEASFVRQFFNIEGVARYAAGKQSGEITPGSWSPILHAQEPLKLDFRAGYRQLVLRIEFEALLRNLSALLGQDVGRSSPSTKHRRANPRWMHCGGGLFTLPSTIMNAAPSSQTLLPPKSNAW